MKHRISLSLAAVFIAAGLLWGAVGRAPAASIPLFGPQAVCTPDQIQACLNALINEINTLVTPQSLGALNNPANLLDNGEMLIQQRGTGAQTCGTTSGVAVTSYSADRWGCDVNVGSGAGSLQVTTSSPTPPPGFQAQELFYRTSGALAQPQCVFQEVNSINSQTLAGTTATFSVWLAGLANMLAEQTTVNLYILTGTGTDQGLGASAVYGSAVGMTASPAITPAWTGIASSITKAVTISSAYAQYFVTGSIPAAAKEVAVAMCWTPTTGGTAGATDGFAFTGAQLNAGSNIANFEHRSYTTEQIAAGQYYKQITEPAAGVTIGMSGTATASTTCELTMVLSPQMYGVPVFSHTGTFGSSTWEVFANSSTAIALSGTTALASSAAVNSKYGVQLIATTSGLTVGWGCVLAGAGGTSSIIFSADF